MARAVEISLGRPAEFEEWETDAAAGTRSRSEIAPESERVPDGGRQGYNRSSVTKYIRLSTRTPPRAMARWPRHAWTSIFTYAVILIAFPILCYLAYAWVRGE
jgi:hypothetical protein